MTTQCLWMKTFVQIVRIEINQKLNLFRAIKPGIDECKPSTRLMWTASVAACPQPLDSRGECDFDLDSRGMGDWLLGDWLFGDFWELFYLAKYQIFSIRVVTLDHHKAWTTRANCANQEDCDCANSAKVDPTITLFIQNWFKSIFFRNATHITHYNIGNIFGQQSL